MKTLARVVALLAMATIMVACGGKTSSSTSSQVQSDAQTDVGNRILDQTLNPSSVEALPKRYQLTLDQVVVIRRVYKVNQDIAVDPSTSERIDCQECAVILNGVILYPPFYLTVIGQKEYLNGYQFWPEKEYPKLDDNPLTLHKKAGFGRTVEEKIWLDAPVAAAITGIAQRALAEGRDEQWIRDQCAAKQIAIKNLVVDSKIHVAFAYRQPSSGRFVPAEFTAGNTDVSPWDPHYVDPRRSEYYHLYKKLLHSGTLIVMNRIVTGIDELPFVLDILESNLDDRVKLFKLELTIINDTTLARGLLANN